MNFSNIVKTTKNNIKRNKWMAFATTFVIAIVFAISTFFIGLTFITQQLLAYYEKKPQIIIYFVNGAPESEIISVKEKVFDPNIMESIRYISEEEAVKIYTSELQDDPELAQSITVGELPASLEIKPTGIESVTPILERLNSEKDANPYIEEIWYMKDVYDLIKPVSSAVNYGGLVIVIALVIITFALIMITIGFNILSHKNEIEIMHLVGSNDQYIRAPFILEGAFYGFVGALISSLILLIPWAISLYFLKNNDFFLLFAKEFRNTGLDFFVEYNPFFIILFPLIEILFGIILGSIGSISAVAKYLTLEDK